MSNGETFRTNYALIEGVDYIFASFDRHLTGEECDDLAKKYFEVHRQKTLPGQKLLVDLRPAFRKPLGEIMPEFHAVSK